MKVSKKCKREEKLMGIMWDLIEHVQLPKVVKVRQNFDETRLENVELAVREQFLKSEISSKIKPGMSIALAVGSRGVALIADITKAVASEVRKLGAEPFIVPAMGSHGGATTEGQKEVLEQLGVTEKYVGCKIRSSMEVYDIGSFKIDETSDEVHVYFDKNAMDSDGVIPIVRVKPHTCFRAPIESGLCKMLTIGLGKQKGANACHQRTFKYMYEMITKSARIKIETGKILFGVASVENAYDKVYTIQVVQAEHFLEADKELLELARSKMPKILFNPIDVLVLRRSGKDVSGDGYDPNVVGKPCSQFVPNNDPYVNVAGILDLTDATHGNSSGIGTVEVITKRLYDKIDFRAMYANAITTTGLDIAKVPMVMENDKEAIMTLVGAANASSFEETRMVIITDSLHVSEFYISESMIPDAKKDSRIEILSEPFEIPFDKKGTLLLSLQQ